jgi:hypothetical protein
MRVRKPQNTLITDSRELYGPEEDLLMWSDLGDFAYNSLGLASP